MGTLLFITRKTRGRGGMQQYSSDLWRACQQMRDVHAERCGPVLAIIAGWRVARKGGHVHLGDAALAPIGWILKRFCSASVSLTAHGLDVVYPMRFYQWMLRLTLPHIDRIVCISTATAEQVRARGIDPKRIVIIPNGIWPEDVALQRVEEGSGSILLTIGRLVKRKGVAWFLREVLPFLLEQNPTLQYWIIGDGMDKRLIKKIVQERGLAPSVRLLGAVNDQARDDAIARADLFVMPNIPVEGDMEGFGMVCIEASARGLPVAAARLEGIEDAMREGQTGLFFQPRNAEECAQVIRRMLASPLDPSVVSQVTKQYYSWPLLLQRYRHEVFHI